MLAILILPARNASAHWLFPDHSEQVGICPHVGQGGLRCRKCPSRRSKAQLWATCSGQRITAQNAARALLARFSPPSVRETKSFRYPLPKPVGDALFKAGYGLPYPIHAFCDLHPHRDDLALFSALYALPVSQDRIRRTPQILRSSSPHSTPMAAINLLASRTLRALYSIRWTPVHFRNDAAATTRSIGDSGER